MNQFEEWWSQQETDKEVFREIAERAWNAGCKAAIEVFAPGMLDGPPQLIEDTGFYESR